MSKRLNDTPEKGWGAREPGEKIIKIEQLEVGGFYLRRSNTMYGGYAYNVVEIIPLPEGFVKHRWGGITYGRFVDPKDLSKPRAYSGGFYAIWEWEVRDPLEIYYKIKGYDYGT